MALNVSGAELARVVGCSPSVARSWLNAARVPRGAARRKLEALYPQVAVADWDRSPALRPQLRETRSSDIPDSTPKRASRGAPKSAKPTTKATAPSARDLVTAAALTPDVEAQLVELLNTVSTARRSDLSAGELARVASVEAQLVERIERVRQASRVVEAAVPVSDARREADALLVCVRLLFVALDGWNRGDEHPASVCRYALRHVGETTAEFADRLADFEDLDGDALDELRAMTRDPKWAAGVAARSA